MRRQRQILAGLAGRYRPLGEDQGGAPPQRLRPIKSFGFSMRRAPEDAVAMIVALLDETDPEWRHYVRVWDCGRGGLDDAVHG